MAMISKRFRIHFIHQWHRFTAILWRGDQRYCPCCDGHFKAFMSFNGRSDALCPRCLSLERTRLLRLYLSQVFFYNHKQADVLHFAPEMALLPFVASKARRYVDADIDPNMARHVVDITRIDFPDQSFDLILCSHILAHVKSEASAIDEMMRCLKPGGVALILTAISDIENTAEDLTADTPSKKLLRFGQDDLWRIYGRDFVSRLQRENNYILTLDYRTRLTPHDIRKMGLGYHNREVFYLMIKV